MRRYLTQIGCVLRPGSVDNADMALRSFAVFFPTEIAPEVASTTQVTRRHIEDYKPWLARRPGLQAPADDRDHRPPARHAADVLRPHG